MKTLLETPKQSAKRRIPPAKRFIWCSTLSAILFLATDYGFGSSGAYSGSAFCVLL